MNDAHKNIDEWKDSDDVVSRVKTEERERNDKAAEGDKHDKM